MDARRWIKHGNDLENGVSTLKVSKDGTTRPENGDVRWHVRDIEGQELAVLQMFCWNEKYNTHTWEDVPFVMESIW